MDPTTGSITVSGPLDVNRQPEFTLALTASDGVYSTSVSVHLKTSQ